MDAREYLARALAAGRAVGGLVGLLSESDDPVAFTAHARAGDIEAAFDTVDRPNDELHQEVTAMRRASLRVGGDTDPSNGGDGE